MGRPAAYVEAGAGRAVVFLHGWGVGHRAYQGSVRQLAANELRVLAPALPGFSGTAPLPRRECSLSGYAAWVVAFLDAIDVTDSVLLVGHSFGGGVATMTALEAPERVRGLVLVNSIGGAAVTAEGELVRAPARRVWDWGVHFARDVRLPSQVWRVLPVVASDVVPNLIQAPRAFLRSAGLAWRADLTSELATLARRGLPVVVIWGRRDRLITDESFRALCHALGDASPITVPGGHNWLLADPSHFGEVMTNVVTVAHRARWLQPIGAVRRWWRRRRGRWPVGSGGQRGDTRRERVGAGQAVPAVTSRRRSRRGRRGRSGGPTGQ
jgi:pimeloyl-ACP methyl ester carboxylesterase